MRRLAVCLVGLFTLHPPELAAQPVSVLPGTLRRWTLSASPVLTIGTEGDSSSEFQRILGVARMPSGETVVANGGTSELRVFSPAGQFLRSLSRRGQGPGEITYINRIIGAGDTVFVTESSPAATTLHLFTMRDGFRSRLQLRPDSAPRGAGPIARLTSGEFLVSTSRFVVVNPVPGQVSRDTQPLGILRGTTPGKVQWIGNFPNISWLDYTSPTLLAGANRTRFTFGPSLVSGVSGDRIWIGDSGTGGIRIYDASGKVVAEARIPVRPRRFDLDELSSAKKAALASASTPDLIARYESLYDRGHLPRSAPLFTRFIPSIDGEMAVELFEERDQSVARSVVVLDRNGRPIAGFITPAGVVPHALGRDYLLGVHTNDDGVERVVQYRLTR